MAKLTERFLRKTHNKTLRTFAPTQDVINQLNKMGVANTRLLGRGVDCELFNPKKRNIALRQSWVYNRMRMRRLFLSVGLPQKKYPSRH